jgi:hypothetical protein
VDPQLALPWLLIQLWTTNYIAKRLLLTIVPLMNIACCIIFSWVRESALIFHKENLTDSTVFWYCMQAALPQGIVPFVFAKEYNVHPDILSTA